MWLKPDEIKGVTMKPLCLFVLLAALSGSAQTNQPPACCRHPYRNFGRVTVNLTPLFQWWQHGGGDTPGDHPPGIAPVPAGGADPRRPLSAWKRITGIKTAELNGAWVVDAEVFTSPATRTNEWILLQNPPAAEELQYYNLQALLPQYDAQIASDQKASQADLKAEEKAAARAKADANGDKWTRQSVYGYNQLAAQKKEAAAAALADQKQYEAARDLARKQLAALPGANGRYQLDCFALEIGRNSRGQLVFDAGVMGVDGAP
jgi:hypothetical protein